MIALAAACGNDVIFLDRRGALKSEPFLSCPEIDAFTESTVGLSWLAVGDGTEAALEVLRGVFPRDFNSYGLQCGVLCREAATLGNSTQLVLPGVGHSASRWARECFAAIMANFLDRPNGFDHSCLAAQTIPQFDTASWPSVASGIVCDRQESQRRFGSLRIACSAPVTNPTRRGRKKSHGSY